MSGEDVDRPAVGLPRAQEALRERTFTGRDPENLVTAVVDGDGMVARITFASSVTARLPRAVAAAVLAAIGDAQRRGADAVLELSQARDTPHVGGPARPDGIVGGTDDGPDMFDDADGRSA